MHLVSCFALIWHRTTCSWTRNYRRQSRWCRASSAHFASSLSLSLFLSPLPVPVRTFPLCNCATVDVCVCVYVCFLPFRFGEKEREREREESLLDGSSVSHKHSQVAAAFQVARISFAYSSLPLKFKILSKCKNSQCELLNLQKWLMWLCISPSLILSFSLYPFYLVAFNFHHYNRQCGNNCAIWIVEWKVNFSFLCIL